MTRKGFTLIELMVVIVILGLLATFIVPKIMSRPDQARVVKVKNDIRAIETALKLYKLDSGFYPTTEQGLEALVKKPATPPIPQNYRPEGYLDKVPKDPWGHPYIYRCPGDNGRPYEIISYGVDGKPGGTEYDADIKSYELQ